MPTTPLEYYMGRRNQECVRLLEENEDVAQFMRGMLEHLVDFAGKEGIRFVDVKLDRPYITHDGYLRARVLR